MTSPCIQGERIARIETQVGDMKDDIKDVLAELKAMNAELTRYKGFLGGAAFVVSCIGVFVTFAKEWIMKHWQ